MDSEIFGAIITATASLISAVIGAWVAITVERIRIGREINTDTRISKPIIVLWAIVGSIAGAIITLVLLGKAPVVSSEKYDDFNNPIFKDSINTDLWKRLQDLNCDVKQDDGVAIFQLNESSAESTLCFLRMPTKVPMSEIGGVDASLLAQNDASGDFSLITIEFQTIGFTADTIWIAQCGIIQKPLENNLELFFYVDNSYPNGENETYQTIEAIPNQWYNMRLEMDPDSGTLRCYVNDKVIGSHKPENVDFLKTQMFNRHITGFWSSESSSTFTADDVILKP